jgi:hypothetical protein
MPISARRHSSPELVFVGDPPSQVCDLDQASDPGDLRLQQQLAAVAQRLTPAELAAEYRRWIVGVSPGPLKTPVTCAASLSSQPEMS